MDTATRELVQQEKSLRKQRKAARRVRRYRKKQAAKQLKADKKAAGCDVNKVAKETAERLAIEPSKWNSEAVEQKVCRRKGPHNDFWCLFHRKKKVKLIRIPRTNGHCDSCKPRSFTEWWGNNSNYSPRDHLSLHLSSDGRICRYGHTKIFEADLMDRPHAKSIRAIIPKLNAME